MTAHVYSITEVVGSSESGIQDAIDNAVATAATSLRNLQWFEVKEIRGHIAGGRPGHYQVTLKLGFRYEPK